MKAIELLQSRGNRFYLARNLEKKGGLTLRNRLHEFLVRTNFPKISVTQSPLPVQEQKGAVGFFELLGNNLALHHEQNPCENITEHCSLLFDLRQIQEKCQELNIGLFVTFLDLDNTSTR